MKKYRIILVENDEDEQMFMMEGFQDAGGFEIIATAHNGNALLEWLNTHEIRPDLVLSDLNMPGMNGMDILNAFRESPVFSQIPVYITSTSSTPSIIEKCMKAGAVDYLVKPDTFIHYTAFVKDLYRRVTEREQGLAGQNTKSVF